LKTIDHFPQIHRLRPEASPRKNAACQDRTNAELLFLLNHSTAAALNVNAKNRHVLLHFIQSILLFVYLFVKFAFFINYYHYFITLFISVPEFNKRNFFVRSLFNHV